LNPVVFYSLLAFVLLWGTAWEFRRHVRHKRPIPLSWITGAHARVPVSVGTIGVGALVTYSETETECLILPAGLILIGLSVFVHVWRKQAATLAECFLMIGFVVLCELPWMCVPLILFYLPILLDEQAAGSYSRSEVGARVLNPVLSASTAYTILLLTALAVGAIKEILSEVL
jgi:hypothetical protein